MTNVMIDLETLGTGSDAMILSVAAVEFNPDNGATKETFYSKVDIDSYKPYTGCFTMDGATLTWWMTTAPEAARREAFLGERLPLKTVLENLAAWINARGNVKPWSHGSCFDIPILSHSFKILGMDTPWKFWDIRDTRTLYDVAGVNLKTLAVTPAARAYPEHHAVGDCLRQIEGVRKSYEILKELRQVAESQKPKKKQKQ